MENIVFILVVKKVFVRVKFFEDVGEVVCCGGCGSEGV